jgi:ABC-type branched-subunit amino acid transport system permease subunit/ABC-type branched-subunit amino acid transport system ATPase component
MEYFMHVLVMVCIYSVLSISFNLLIGFAGLFALSQAVFFAIGAYGTGLLAVAGLPFPLPEIGAVVIGAGVGVLVALPALRTRGDYLVIVTLALQIVVLQVILNWKSLTGGTEGVRGIPGLSFAGIELIDPSRFVVYAALVAALVFVLSWKAGHSPFGRSMKAMRENESATQAAGKNLLYLKVTAFAGSAGLAALAGTLFARYFNYVSVDSFSINETIYILAMVIVGGIGNLWGSVLGAVVLVVLPELLKFLHMPTEIADQMRLVIYGVVLILVLRFRPEGLIPEPRGAMHHGGEIRSHASAETLMGGESGIEKGQTIIEAKGLVKRFGGITAVSGFDIDMKAGQITGLIGPNGAGKTTAFNMLTGFLQPNEGSITLRGSSILGLKPHRIVGAGVARSFQDLRLFRKMTVLDNVLVSLPNQTGENVFSVFMRPGTVRREEEDNLSRAIEVLKFVELDGKANETVNALSYAEEKLLVIARLLATGAEVLLFDEPLSGLDPTTLSEILPVIRRLADSGKVVCIIEHNLDVIKELSDVVYFLDEGHAMAVGTPEEVMTNPELAERYFK